MSVAEGNPTDSMFSNIKEGTQLMSIYTPYFYIIQDIRNGMYYAGAKWGKNSDPQRLLMKNGYQTSSKTVKKIIKENGLDVFIIRKIRFFKNKEDTQLYETRFLRKIDARNHKKFYNIHNNEGGMDRNQIEKILIQRYGVSSPMHSSEIKEKMKKNNLEKYGVEYTLQREDVKQKRFETNLQKYGVKTFSETEEYKSMVKNTNNLRYGVDYFNQQEYIRKELSNMITVRDKNGNVLKVHKDDTKWLSGEYVGVQKNRGGHKLSDETKAKISKNNVGFLGKTHSEESKRKISEKLKDTFSKQKSSICPHCCLVGKGPNMKRYHFDNCKTK